MEWFKFYHNKWLTDRAIASLIPQDRLCFLTLLCVTSQSDDRTGTVTLRHEDEIIRLTQLEVNFEDPEKCDFTLSRGFLQRLADVGLIKIISKTEIVIPNFIKRQETNLSGAERSKKYRDKNRVTEHVTTVTNKSDERTARVEKIREDIVSEDKSSPKKKMNNYEEPTIDIDTGEEVSQIPKVSHSQKYWELILYLEKVRGTKMPRDKQAIGKQFKYLKLIRESVDKISKVKERIDEMSEDDFWKEKGFDFKNVYDSFVKKGV